MTRCWVLLSGIGMSRLARNTRDSPSAVPTNARAVTRRSATVYNLRQHCALQQREVKLAGFGNFIIRAKSPRPGRIPHTGAVLLIAARNVVTFRASPRLKALT